MSQSFELPAPLPLEQQRGQTFEALVRLMQRLLGPDGCPWDREQTKQTLRPYVLEEACEVLDAIDSGSDAELAEELGDLALQIVFQGELARQAGSFGPDDVIRGICEKLVHRHPHVFGETQVAGSEEVARNWEALKVREKGPRALLAGVPRALPALQRAQTLSDKAARIGFDWPDPEGSRAKVSEELGELDQAVREGDRAEIQAEFGDVLFALVNFARQYGIDAEEALRRAVDKFFARFAHVERRVMEQHGDWPRDVRGKPATGLGLQELDAYWDEAKALERQAKTVVVQAEASAQGMSGAVR